MDEHRTYTFELGGRILTLEFGKVAKQANGAVLVRYGETTVLATATASKQPREGIDFFPLTVDVEERLYAVGRIPGSWGRREGRPPEKAILQARVTDRPIRPLFPKGLRNDVQVVVMPLSIDHDHSPEIAGMIGASAALTVSDIPWEGPMGAVDIGLVDGQFVINPVVEDVERSDLRLTVAGTKDAVLMVEAGANQVSEDVMVDAIMYGHEVIREICLFLEKVREEVGKPKFEPVLYLPGQDIVERVAELATPKVRQAIRVEEKLSRESFIEDILQEVYTELGEEFAEREAEISEAFHSVLKAEVRGMILETGRRPDGRGPDDIRPITCEVAVLPRVHGSAIFTRGQTQVMSIATLGAKGDIQELDTTGIEETKRYLHHYNFPPYSVGETRPLRGPGRREIGHGALAERALLPVVPGEEEFPYTIRVVSEVLESNGSTSMASVCGSTLSLMDAGVPIKAPVAGIAMGLIKGDDKTEVLTDIQGMEDALGDMDFKVAGTKEGVTALQMDIKIAGVDRSVLTTALDRAKKARLFILGKISEAIPAPREQLSEYAPRIIVVNIDPDKIRDVIGPGGKTINKITAETGVKIDIEQDGRVFIAAPDMESGDKAREIVETLTRDIEVGRTYKGKVTRLASFGAFVEVLPGKEGLVRTPEAALEDVHRIEDVMNVGDEVLVKVIEIDHMGRVNLSRRQALGGAPAPRESRGDRDGGRGDRRPQWRRDGNRNGRDRDRSR
ncbi:MAG: polyribonucleotide nucleotidyltransferase [Bacillota bacterium]|nr:polyribonucleotide nucleotidyltransferase [Candidatus Fermentithermobacillaceae bacterium]